MHGTRTSLPALVAALAAAITLSCSSSSTTGPNGGGTGGGPVGSVKVGNNFFESGHNGTRNPAKDTVAAGQTVTWTWTGTGGTAHSVRSDGSFASSQTMTGNGATYQVTFPTPGTYRYDCAVHGSAMSGTVVVQ